MANAPIGCVWLTVQGHQNIVAVAVSAGNGRRGPDRRPGAGSRDRWQRPTQERIPILRWPPFGVRTGRTDCMRSGVGGPAAGLNRRAVRETARC
ncbi:MAG: hypothetical protein MZV70_18695 [Desulfobacterales bacterium]|nr:hypothetical protein [Desulfobacterales bacterium]